MKHPVNNILGIQIHNLSFDDFYRDIFEGLHNGKRQRTVVTANVDHLMKLQTDVEFQDVYKNADIATADGVPLLWAGKFLGTPFKCKISGSDVFPEICKRAINEKKTIFLLGGRPGAAEKAIENLTAQYGDLPICGTYCPPFGFENDPIENSKLIDSLKAAQPDILFIGLGAPKQEKWIHKHKKLFDFGIALGVGVSFEFTANMVKRAPKWMQKSGLEWFWRLMQEPKRLWKRYLVDDTRFFWYLLKQKLGKSGKSK